MVEYLYYNRDDGGSLRDALNEARDAGHADVVEFLAGVLSDETSGYFYEFQGNRK